MSPINRNTELSIYCPKCKETFKETIDRLKEMGSTLICPDCGPVQVDDADEHRRMLQQVERVLSELEHPSKN